MRSRRSSRVSPMADGYVVELADVQSYAFPEGAFRAVSKHDRVEGCVSHDVVCLVHCLLAFVYCFWLEVVCVAPPADEQHGGAYEDQEDGFHLWRASSTWVS